MPHFSSCTLCGGDITVAELLANRFSLVQCGGDITVAELLANRFSLVQCGGDITTAELLANRFSLVQCGGDITTADLLANRSIPSTDARLRCVTALSNGLPRGHGEWVSLSIKLLQ